MMGFLSWLCPFLATVAKHRASHLLYDPKKRSILAFQALSLPDYALMPSRPSRGMKTSADKSLDRYQTSHTMDQESVLLEVYHDYSPPDISRCKERLMLVRVPECSYSFLFNVSLSSISCVASHAAATPLLLWKFEARISLLILSL